MREKLIKLIDVKSIITFSVVGMLLYLAFKGKIQPDKIYDLGLMVVGYFFGVKKAVSDIKQ